MDIHTKIFLYLLHLLGKKKVKKLNIITCNLHSTSVNSKIDYSSKFVSHLLKQIYISDDSKKNINNYDLQSRIESRILDEFDLFFSNNVNKYRMGGINTDALGASIIKYIFDKESILKFYIDKLQTSYLKNKYTKKDEIFIGLIINTVYKSFLFELCLVHFLLVYTYQN